MIINQRRNVNGRERLPEFEVGKTDDSENLRDFRVRHLHKPLSRIERPARRDKVVDEEEFLHKLESRLQGEISITSDMQMTPPLWQKVKKN